MHQQTFDQLAQDLAALDALLEAEFALLRDQQLAEFEAMQPEKEALIARIAAIDFQSCAGNLSLPQASAESRTHWELIVTLTANCREHQKRNEFLVNRKLTAVKDALRALRLPIADDQPFYGPGGRLTAR